LICLFVASALEQEDPDSALAVVDASGRVEGEVDLEHDDLDHIEEGDIDFDKGPLTGNPCRPLLTPLFFNR
jgi:hypothetical protein